MAVWPLQLNCKRQGTGISCQVVSEARAALRHAYETEAGYGRVAIPGWTGGLNGLGRMWNWDCGRRMQDHVAYMPRALVVMGLGNYDYPLRPRTYVGKGNDATCALKCL